MFKDYCQYTIFQTKAWTSKTLYTALALMAFSSKDFVYGGPAKCTY